MTTIHRDNGTWLCECGAGTSYQPQVGTRCHACCKVIREVKDART